MNEKNKRKTIILTFIGALTLLFVVVGGTFAYFQIVNTDEGSTSTDFEAQTDNLNKYGTPLLTKKSDLYISLSASDMSYSKGGTPYYATLKTEPQEKNYEEERKNHVISTASIERPEGEDVVEDAYLSCTSELTITIDGTMKDVLETGDGTLYLGVSTSGKNKGSIDPSSFDLADLVSKQESGENKVTVNYTIVGYTSVDVTADVEIVNKANKPQNLLSGTNITITITNNNLSCSVSEKPKPIYAILDTAINGPSGDGNLYRSGEYQLKIVNASFVDYIPNEEELEGKPKYWDLSDTESGTPEKSVIGWLESNKETPENYDLYIGSNSEIYVKDLSMAFRQMGSLKEINFDNLNTSETTNMDSMFCFCENLTTLDLSGFDTSKVTNMSGMFYNYKGATLDLSNFDTSQVTDMSIMFDGVTVDLPFEDWPNFVTSNVEDMTSMFSWYNGTTLDLSSFDTSKVINMSYMFYKCNNLTTLDLSSFNPSLVINMCEMFYGCSSLEELDLSNFTFDNVTNGRDTFFGVSSSCQVKINQSQGEIFKSEFPLNGSSYQGARTFTIPGVDD